MHSTYKNLLRAGLFFLGYVSAFIGGQLIAPGIAVILVIIPVFFISIVLFEKLDRIEKAARAVEERRG